MTLFFRTVSVEDAVKAARSVAVRVQDEEISLTAACGRVLAADITADIDIPGFTRATMDG